MQPDSEYSAAEPGDGISWTDVRSEFIGNCNQKLIANHMAQTIIDCFESIEIQEQDRKRSLLLPLKPLHRLLQLVHKKHPIRQASQGIMKCIMDQFFFGLFAVADVLHLEHQICRMALGIFYGSDA